MASKNPPLSIPTLPIKHTYQHRISSLMLHKFHFHRACKLYGASTDYLLGFCYTLGAVCATTLACLKGHQGWHKIMSGRGPGGCATNITGLPSLVCICPSGSAQVTLLPAHWMTIFIRRLAFVGSIVPVHPEKRHHNLHRYAFDSKVQNGAPFLCCDENQAN